MTGALRVFDLPLIGCLTYKQGRDASFYPPVVVASLCEHAVLRKVPHDPSRLGI